MVDAWRIRYERPDSRGGFLYLREISIRGNGASVKGVHPVNKELSFVFAKSVALALAVVLRRFGYSAAIVRADMPVHDFLLGDEEVDG